MRKAKKQLKAICPKCLEVRLLQGHHIFPSRFYKRNNTTHLLYLCDDCHKEIEAIIPQYQKLTKEEYIDIHKKWLRGEEVIIKWRFEKYWIKKGRRQFLFGGNYGKDLYS